ncbi:MAG TPA: DUF5916 domain-containing protein, partial [Longimicrobiales bacterium]|nr:DUF5916 domain-containing protein [Longimicrobiales bacterium]
MRAILLTLMSTACAAAAAAQSYEPPSMPAIRLGPGAEPPVVDGRLDDAAWRSALPASGFRQREPRAGEPATDRTEVRVLVDDAALYIAVFAYDAEPAGIVGRILRRDRVMASDFDGRPMFAGDDAIAILLDPFHDHRNAFVFATNPNGAEFDALLTDEGREFNTDWRGVWRVAAERGPDGWSAEFAIPLRTLRFPEGGGETWGLNVYRIVQRTREETLWSSWSREAEGFHRVSRAGHLTGMEDLPPAGANLEIRPYVLSGATRAPSDDAAGQDAFRTSARFDVGADLKYEIRPGLTLDATANTDFAQVEVDEEQVNLTRFDLFFPEKRDFFLENAGVFEFGLRGFFEPPPFLLFFSRRIGIADEGEVPLLGGARLTGRVGGQTVGLLNAITDEAHGHPRENFAVARVKRDIGGSGYIGLMATDRRSAASWNTTGGADFSVWRGALNVQGFYGRTATAGVGGDDHGYRLALDYTGDRFGFFTQHITVGPDANAAMGFITRTDMRRTDGFGRVTFRPPALGLRRVDTFLGATYVSRVDGAFQDAVAGPFLSVVWNSGESFTGWLQPGRTRLDEPFELGDVGVQPGDYGMTALGWFASTSPSRPVVIGSSGSVQWVYDGRIASAGTTLSAAPDPHVSATIGYTRNAVDLPGGAFTADIGSLRLSYAASTRLFADALVQYNSLDNQLSANLRLNLIHRPGSDLFVVLNERRGG